MLSKFFQFVEIKTKITSLFAFIMTLAFLFYSGQPIQIKLTAVFFLAMFIFDLTTTAINNYIDSRDYPQMLPFSRKTGLLLIWVMFLFSAALGLYLALCTDIVVLLTGMLCFLCGVCYTYGPVPISRLPLGEVCSGIFYGALIPFLLLYINMPAGTYLSLQLGLEEIHLSLQVMPLLCLLLLCIPPTCVTADIMLANNICDVEPDVKVNRFTLPYYLGNKHSVNLFALLFYICYLSPCIMVAAGFLHPVCLIHLVTFPLVQKNIQIFRKEQRKATTFITSIKNYVIIMSSYSVSIFVGGIVERL